MVVDHNRMIIQIRRQKVWSLITQGMKGYEIARAINIDPPTVSRDIRYLTANSQNYLNDLADVHCRSCIKPLLRVFGR